MSTAGQVGLPGAPAPLARAKSDVATNLNRHRSQRPTRPCSRGAPSLLAAQGQRGGGPFNGRKILRRGTAHHARSDERDFSTVYNANLRIVQPRGNAMTYEMIPRDTVIHCGTAESGHRVSHRQSASIRRLAGPLADTLVVT